MQEAAAAAAEKLAEAAEAAADEASPGGDAAEELLVGEGDEWSFLTKAGVAVLVVIVCLIANRVSLCFLLRLWRASSLWRGVAWIFAACCYIDATAVLLCFLVVCFLFSL